MLENLPFVVLEMICEFLAVDDPKRYSILAMSMTSRTCSAASERMRFRNIQLNLASDEKFRESLASLNTTLSRGKQHRHIRQVQIMGQVRMPYIKDGFDPKKTIQELAERISQPIMEFLSLCKGMKYLVWVTNAPLPQCVLELLQTHPCYPRLHVDIFILSNRYRKLGQFHNIDPEGYALGRSPNLHSIAYRGMTSVDATDDNAQAILQLVANPFINIEHVNIKSTVHTPGSLEDAPPPLSPAWRFVKDQQLEPIRTKGRLKSLAIRGRQLDRELLQTWLNSTDVTKLRSLSLGSKITATAFEALQEIAAQNGLANISRLSLAGIFETPSTPESDLIATFLSLLNPLEVFILTGRRVTLILESILVHFNFSLKTLHLYNRLTVENIEYLQINCPNLEDLRLSIKRTQGDEQEVHLYQVLGSLRKLAHLTLLIDYADPDISNRMGEGSSSLKVAQYERMKKGLRNSAIDKDLATAIFRIILHANRTSRPGVIPTFTRLELLDDDTKNRCSAAIFSDLQRWTCQEWMCERKHADIQSNEVWITEISRLARTRAKHRLEDYILSDIKPAWEANWLIPPGTLDWLHTWHSFPLHSGDRQQQ